MNDGEPVSLVVRALPGPAANGFVVGELESVASGLVVPLRRGDDLVATICDAVATARRLTDRGATAG